MIVSRATSAPLARVAAQVEVEVPRMANHVVHDGARKHVHGAALCIPSGASRIALLLLLLQQQQQQVITIFVN